MGIFSNTISICQFIVTGSKPDGDISEWVSEGLNKHGFDPIENDTRELSIGWVQMNDNSNSQFLVPIDFSKENYFVMTLRKDQKRISQFLLKASMQEAEEDFLNANVDYKYVPKSRKSDLKDVIKANLLSRTLPTPVTYDAVWDTKSNILTLTTLSESGIETFMNLFSKTFEGLNLSLFHPYMRAESILPDELKSKLASLNQAGNTETLSLINSNLWIGKDFLLYLMYNTMNKASQYKVNQDGHFQKGNGFVAYIDDRLVLTGEDEKGKQKVTIVGPQNRFNEVRTALQDQKQITEATIYLEVRDEDIWKVTLKGDRFYFSSFKSPSVQIEKDDLTDKVMEKEAVFYERMFLVEKGIQLFNSIYCTFLQDRLGSGWIEMEREIQKWVSGA